MGKRPLALLCLAAAIILSLIGGARSGGRDDALAKVQDFLAETAGTDEVLTLEGTVTEINAVSEGIRLSVNSIILYTNEEQIGSLSSELKLILTIESENFLPGDRVRVTGTYWLFEKAGNPGQFDSLGYYFTRNTVGRITGPNVTLISVGNCSLFRILARFRRALRYSYMNILEEKAAHTVSAISLGEKSFMEQEWKQLYQEGGIAHIISISGLHISMIGMCIYKLLRRLRLPFCIAALPAAAVVALYALMSGFGISAMRACLMFVIWLGAQIVGRKYDMLTAAAIAAALLLAGDGRAATQSSFLLSFGAILSIALLVPRLAAVNPFRRKPFLMHETTEQRHFTRKASMEIMRQTAARIWDALCGGMGVWIGTLPATLWFFYQTAPWSILVNLLVIPLMSALMSSALISGLVGLVSVPLGTFLAAPVYYLLGLFEGLCRIEQQMPCAVWIAGCPAIWKIAVYYALLTGAAALIGKTGKNLPKNLPEKQLEKLLEKQPEKLSGKPMDGTPGNPMRKRKRNSYKRMAERTACGIWLITVIFGLCLMACRPRSGLTAVSLDVGQGDGALLMLPDGTNCLIDGGSSSVRSLWEYRISQTLKYYGISRLDYIFLSHADSDHISGVQEYLEAYLPGFAGRNVHGITLKNLVLPPTADETDFEELSSDAESIGAAVLRMEAGGFIGTTAVEEDTPAGTSAAGSGISTGTPAAGSGTSAGTPAAGSGTSTGTSADGWSLTCLAPSAGALSGDKNEDSMVLLLQYGSFRMLFTGDLEGDAETALAASGADLSCDVLKVGHHGSKGASSEEFLAAVSPAFGIISCGKNNRYGHPAEAALERLRAANITLYTTMDCGAVIVRSDGSGYRISGFLG
ncbi:MAG: ComEC/Rec2 family competence protein [Clostridiales bacterium]|nr:ComEC/Rec2 family competence protein [Clostridiales bacterium]